MSPLQKKYTIQALQRVGYVLDTASPVTVSVKPVEQDGLSPDRYMAEWRVIHERRNDLCHSIEDVLYAVREIAVK